MGTLLLFVACQSAGDGLSMVEKDLLSYGVPITIQVPDSADIKSMDWGLQKDITIKDGWFNLQIFSSRALTHSMDKLKANHLDEIRRGPYFSQVMTEDPDGFIFEVTVDSVNNYDFRHLKIQGDNEYVFQAGMLGNFTLEQIEHLYQVAKEAR